MKNSKIQHLIPVLMAFFVMSFADLAGTGVDELKQSAEPPVTYCNYYISTYELDVVELYKIDWKELDRLVEAA
ncbi:MAG: hypothetical protein ABFS32_03580 [Bacteroidota bacterium]